MVRNSTTHLSFWKKLLIASAALLAAVLIVLIWYRVYYAMNVVHPFQVVGSSSGPRVLIATQGSDFKDAITAKLLEHLQRRSARVNVIDVAGLDRIRPSDWDAIVVMNTWEMGKPPAAVNAFIARLQSRGQLVVLTTSGAGDFKLQGVDAISAASRMVDVPARVSELANKLDAILDAGSRSAD